MARRREEWDDLTPADRAVKLGRAGAPALSIDIEVEEKQLLARGNVVMEGYWDQPEATAEALKGGWFHTGDGGFIDDENYVNISDRIKDVIISGGENVSSIEVEDCLFQHPAVAEAAVIGVPDDRWGETVVALVIARPGASPAADELVQYARERLAGYKLPRIIRFVDELPRSPTGKVLKRELRERYG
jgi:acyl-CoA synthetase (AMP-forming)/AMP-acid ligase II